MDLKAGCGLAATVIALAGCGGSESGGAEDAAREGSPPRAERLSKAEARYVERLDAACKEGDEISGRLMGQVDRLARRLLPKAETSKRVVELVDASRVEQSKILKRIRRLEAPPGEKRFRRRYLAYSERLEMLKGRGKNAIARGASVRTGELAPIRRKINLVTKRRAALVADHGGFDYCG